MKVLQINAVYGISSTGRTTMELDRALQEQGHQSLVATTKANCQREQLYIVGNKRDWKLHALCSRLFGMQGYFSAGETRKLISYIEREKPDIIHLRNLHANYIHIPMLLRYIAEKAIPTVITLHDCWFFTGKCCYYTDDNCEKWKAQCGNCPALRKWNESWFLDRSQQMLADKKKLFQAVPRLAVIGVSDWITNEARQSILKDAWLVKRIYNWINLDVFKPVDTTELRKKLNLEHDFVVVGVAQTWSAEKGIYIFQKIAEAMPEIKVVLIGELPEQFAMPDNVVSIGVLSDERALAAYYSMADVMVNPSVQETFGKTTAEAIAAGTPVIGYNLTATPELIGNGCGVVVEPKDGVDAFVNAVKVVQALGKEYYRDACCRFANQNFSKDNLIQEYIDLYRVMLQ